MNIFFKNPQFLWGLLFIAIPIIVHLFNFRKYKTVYFGDINFLKSVKEKNKSNSKLKHLLILLSRIFFIISLVLIFAQPYLSDKEINNDKNQNLIVSIYIDNSFSSGLESENGILLENIKQNAISIADSYKGNARFLLITNDMPVKFQYIINYENLINYISEIKTCYQSKTLKEIIELNKDIVKNEANKLYILSDFQANIITDDLKKYIDKNISLIPVEAKNTNNISVDSCYFETPYRKFGQKEKLFVVLHSYSDKEITDLAVKLYINDSLKAVSSVDLKPNSTAKIFFDYTNTEKGFYKAEIKIEDYPILFDNSLFFNYFIKPEIKITGIGEKDNIYLSTAFNIEDYYKYQFQKSTSIEYSEIKNSDVVVFFSNNETSTGFINRIKKFIENDGIFILIPNTEKDYSIIYNNILNNITSLSFGKLDSNNVIENIDNNIDIFRNIFDKIDEKTILPNIKKLYTTNTNSYKSEILLKSKTNNALLLRNKIENGLFYTFSFDAISDKEKSFNKSPLFIPVLYNIASTKSSSVLYHKINNNQKVVFDKQYNEALKIENKKYDVDFISRTNYQANKVYLYIGDYIKHSGNYSVLLNNQEISCLSFNYDRNESKMKFLSTNDLKDFIENNKLNWKIYSSSNEHLTQEITNTSGIKLWYYFVIAALFFLILETVFIRLFKIR